MTFRIKRIELLRESEPLAWVKRWISWLLDVANNLSFPFAHFSAHFIRIDAKLFIKFHFDPLECKFVRFVPDPELFLLMSASTMHMINVDYY